MTVLIDTGSWIDYFEGAKRAKRIVPFIEGNEKIVISTINIIEITHQFLKRKPKEDVEKIVDILLQYSFAIPVDTNIASHAVKLKHQHGFSLADAIIYATAQDQHALLITTDNDFKGLKDVECIE